MFIKEYIPSYTKRKHPAPSKLPKNKKISKQKEGLYDCPPKPKEPTYEISRVRTPVDQPLIKVAGVISNIFKIKNEDSQNANGSMRGPPSRLDLMKRA